MVVDHCVGEMKCHKTTLIEEVAQSKAGSIKVSARASRSDASHRPTDWHSGPTSATDGGGSMATTNSPAPVSKKGRSVSSSGLRARRKAETTRSAMLAWKTTRRQLGV